MAAAGKSPGAFRSTVTSITPWTCFFRSPSRATNLGAFVWGSKPSRSDGDMLVMKYRTRLFVLVVALVVSSNGLLAFASHRQCDALLHQEVHRKLRSIAATAAVLVEPELVAAIRVRPDEARPEYGPLRAQLQKIRNANRRQDAWVERIFTLVPARENSNMVEYGVDSEERFELVHHAGDIYTRDGAPVSIGIDGIDKLADRLEHFQAGYNAAFAPIRDGSGKLIAELGIVGAFAPSSTLHQVGPRFSSASGSQSCWRWWLPWHFHGRSLSR
jgi:hypothetical protein